MFTLVFCQIMMMVGCGGKNKSTTENSNDSSESYVYFDNTYNSSNNQSEYTEDRSESGESGALKNVNITWKEIKTSQTDSDGYSYEITFKLSPWILISNTEIINRAWKEVGGNNSLPGFNDWGLKDIGNRYFKSQIGRYQPHWFSYAMNDMYYCIGTVSIKNTTANWNITSENNRSVTEILRWEHVDMPEQIDSCGAGSLCKVFYSSSTDLSTNVIAADASMNSNSWGPVSFVMMVPENFSPNYPNGQYYEYHRGGYFFGREKEYKIGIIGKDGTYVEPE